MGLFNKIKKLNIFSGLFSVDEDFFEELEESLILSDMGMETTLEAVETLREPACGRFWWTCWRWESPAWTCPASRR